MRPHRYDQYWAVQTHTGPQYGWETVSAATGYREAKGDLKSYRENQPEYAHRVKWVRERVYLDT